MNEVKIRKSFGKKWYVDEKETENLLLKTKRKNGKFFSSVYNSAQKFRYNQQYTII
jgi:hypothetical protein